MALCRSLRDALKEIMGIRKGETALIIHDSYAQQVSDITREALQLEGVKVETYHLPERGARCGKSRTTWPGSSRRSGRPVFQPARRASAKRRRSASRSSTGDWMPGADRALAGHHHGHDRRPHDRGLRRDEEGRQPAEKAVQGRENGAADSARRDGRHF